ncbi:hypothetical protein J3E69DRAFT_352079 [Trichoderma sp. SZMC 28015]
MTVPETSFLWAAEGIFLVVFLFILVFCFIAPESDRVFHYLHVTTLFVGVVAYYAQASGNGFIVNSATLYQFSWVRYVYWAVSWPAICLSLGLLSGVSWVTILTNVGISWIWVVSYLAGAFVEAQDHDYKWGFFAFGTFCWLILVASTLNEGREAAERFDVKRDYLCLAIWTNLAWVLFPVAYGLSDLTHKLSPESGVIFFGILDLLQLPVLALALLFFTQKWDFGRLGLAFSEFRVKPRTESLSV